MKNAATKRLITAAKNAAKYMGNMLKREIKTEVDNKEIKRCLNFFYGDATRPYDVRITITDVKFYKNEKDYTVVITTYRPGLIIGEQGEYINRFEEYINSSNKFDMPVKIELKECDMWFNLY